MLALSPSSYWNSQASGRSSAMSIKVRDIIFFLKVSGRGHRELAVQAVTVVEGKSAAGMEGIAAVGVVVAIDGATGGTMVEIKATSPRAVAGGVTPISTTGVGVAGAVAAGAVVGAGAMAAVMAAGQEKKNMDGGWWPFTLAINSGRCWVLAIPPALAVGWLVAAVSGRVFPSPWYVGTSGGWALEGIGNWIQPWHLGIWTVMNRSNAWQQCVIQHESWR